jgi:hypothetical protein
VNKSDFLKKNKETAKAQKAHYVATFSVALAVRAGFIPPERPTHSTNQTALQGLTDRLGIHNSFSYRPKCQRRFNL